MTDTTAPVTSATASVAWPTLALSAAASAFEALTRGAHPPLALDCATFADPAWSLPQGMVSLAVLRDWILAHPREFDARDAVWREVLNRARQDGPQACGWVVGAIGLAMPVLRAHARTLGAGFRGDPDDLDAEILTGFLAALRGDLDPTRTAPYAKLTTAAWLAGRALRAEQDGYVPVPQMSETTGSRVSREAPAHPDLMVMRAARIGLIDHEDAFAFIEVRLGEQCGDTVAERLGITASELRHRLARVSDILADALRKGLLSGLVVPHGGMCPAKAAVVRSRIRAAHAIATRRNAAEPAPTTR